jgi:hypothetical protein
MIYMTSVYILLNLDTEVSTFDRERVLRSLRERLKSTFGHNITVRTEDDTALVVAFLEDTLERVHRRSEAILNRLEEAGEARILSHQRQVFAWVDAEFRELKHERDESELVEGVEDLKLMRSRRPGGRASQPLGDDDDVSDEDPFDDDLSRRTQRRAMRIPVRK